MEIVSITTLNEPWVDITFCDVLPIKRSFSNDAQLITVDENTLFSFYENKVDIYLIDVVLNCENVFVQGCLKDDYLLKWHNHKMSEAEGFEQWLIGRIEVDFEMSEYVNNFLKAKQEKNEIVDVTMDTIEQDLAEFIKDEKNAGLLAYHTTFEKLPLVGSLVWNRAMEWVIDDIYYDGKRFQTILRRQTSAGAILRHMVSSEKIRKTWLGTQVVSRSFWVSTKDWLSLFYIPQGIATGLSMYKLREVVATLQNAPVVNTLGARATEILVKNGMSIAEAINKSYSFKNSILIGTNYVLLSTGFIFSVWHLSNYIWGIIKDQPDPSVVITEGFENAPKGMRQYTVLDGVTHDQSLINVRDGVLHVLNESKKVVKTASINTVGFVQHMLKITVLIGILGVTYKVLTIAHEK